MHQNIVTEDSRNSQKPASGKCITYIFLYQIMIAKTEEIRKFDKVVKYKLNCHAYFIFKTDFIPHGSNGRTSKTRLLTTEGKFTG
ncbi:hypothetical protein ERO13_D08G025166v2 [Gossypium hirsutum]|uniref:Uncharacterized protein n=3 Tax=Gossypium TaxID=3633 RepID=A0A5J5Q8D6_GOSBA|nr:hypothetical protein ES319_D08G019800v1 [Gossypium barbadense]KAG4132320.1 hypothetical protein ERO13_D08G025166v2 [Gossypium hirsutum]TYG55908.1 hypothetical protein ES288_D08G020900v1 [Gossypium darwinii]TYH56460.1 hypothetical protein ES332_D08G020600v1 [Gossypium tomentosum]